MVINIDNRPNKFINQAIYQSLQTCKVLENTTKIPSAVFKKALWMSH